MVREKLLINRFTAAEALMNSMPELNAGLAQLPAQINFLAVELSRKVDQANIEVLHYASIFMDLFQRRLQAKREGFAPVFLFLQFGMIYQHAAQHGDPARKTFPLGFRLLVFGLEQYCIPDRRLNLGKQLLGLLQRKEPGHPIRMGRA